MTPFRITHKADNSAYESSLSVNLLKGVGMLSIGIQDNNGVNIVFCMDRDELLAMAAYIEGQIK